MKYRNQAIILCLLMIISTAIVPELRPTKRVAALTYKVNLHEIFPTNFGDWHEEINDSVALVDPVREQTLRKIYSQTLSRTYANSEGRKIMLSVAYGEDQRADMAVHYPEVCYPSQGFSVNSNNIGSIKTAYQELPVRRLETSFAGQRYEPVTYWTTIGNSVSVGGFDRRIKELSYGLKGVIPDGFLIRVSSIDKNSKLAFDEHEKFIEDLMNSISTSHRVRLAGR